MKIGPGISDLWRVDNRPLPLTTHMAYTTACTTVQAVIILVRECNRDGKKTSKQLWTMLSQHGDSVSARTVR